MSSPMGIAAAHSAVERLGALGYSNEELWLWLAEIGAAADLWSGRAQSARNRMNTRDGTDPSLTEERRAPAGCSLSRPGRPLTSPTQTANSTVRSWPGSCTTGPTRRRASAPTPVASWARPTAPRSMARWPGCAVPAKSLRGGQPRTCGHPTTYRITPRMPAGDLPRSSWTLGAARTAEAELAAAHAAAERHIPLQRQIEGLPAGRGCCSRSCDEVPDSAPQADAPGNPRHGLTPRELAVLRLLGSGATNVEIGRRLYISPKTASVHVTSILRKLGVTGRVQAATVAERMGLLAPDGEVQPERWPVPPRGAD